ncbi:Piwi-like protein Ago3 [Nymphon striatum]|nr:Piwi-like protein Ago3 [Nymphon striatum]
MSDHKLGALGRGGRGALLREALLKQQQQRRPGEEVSKDNVQLSKNEPGEQKRPALGRAALLSQFQKAAVVASTTTASTAPTTTSTQQTILKGLGRSRPSMTSPPKSSTPFVVSNRETTSPDSTLSEKMDNLKVAEKPTIIKKGKDGKPINLATNFIRMIRTGEDRDIIEYHVSFSPNIDSKNIRFKLIHQLTETIGKVRVFDGAKLYLPFRLPQKETICSAVRHTDDANIKVKIKFISAGNSQCRIHLYNVLFKKVMRHLNLARIGRNDYDPKGGIEIPQHRLEVWPGYVTAITDYEDGIMLNCDASFRVLRKVTAYDILQQCAQRNASQIKDEAVRQLLGNVVLTRYNNKTYRIDDIDWSKNPTSKFSTRNGDTSFVDYYKAEDTELICLIPELCYLTGLTDEMRNDFRIMKDIATHTRISPQQRQNCLNKFRDNIMKNPESKQVLEEWGLALDENNLQLQGRLLKMEDIIFKDSTAEAGPFADWGRACINNQVISAVDLNNWVMVCTKRNQTQVSDFIQKLKVVGKKFGMHVADPRLNVLNTDHTDAFIRCIREQISPVVQLFVFVFPTSRDDRYSAVKKLCCVEHPVSSQVIIAKTISQAKNLTSVTQKIALQINCKLGGELWGVRIPVKQLMICGVDVYHDAKTRGRSCVGFTASINQNITRWFSNAHFQNSGEELVNGLKIFLVSACRKYYEVNHELPQKIVVYRDGVGDGQLTHVADYEVPQLLDSLKCFGSDYNPSLTIIIVQKRINARMFLNNRNGLENPSPGSVLDHTVTRKHWYDYFLVSQHVRQGTVSPTHYIVVYDTSKFTPDHIQRLTYKMTHLYYNWPGTIRSPAPCQYAHKLAYLIGQNVHKLPSPELSDRLYYL